MDLIAHISQKEVDEAVLSIDSDSAPGIDGWNGYFFKKVWQLIRYDVHQDVLLFLSSGLLYEAINCTYITLIPKCLYAETIQQCRPISCCSTLCKIISKILARGCKMSLGTI